MRVKLSPSKKRRALTTPAIKKVNVKRQKIQFVEEEYLNEEIFQETYLKNIFKENQRYIFILYFTSLFLIRV